MTVRLFKGDNRTVLYKLWMDAIYVDAVYADCIYESTDFNWIAESYRIMKPNGVFFVQTDYHSVYMMKLFCDKIFGEENFINHLIYIQEWGGVPKKAFPRKHDDILFYTKGENYKWYPDRIQIPKATAGTAFDKKGTGMKTPCDVFYDLGNFSTMDSERVKDENGKNIQWQKPLKLVERLLLPTTDVGDVILDPFLGSGTTGVWAVQNNRDFLGIEIDASILEIARERIANA
jgi:site-specific DNA-methyltransferase (adenine-specific)